MGIALGILAPLILIGEAHDWSRAALWWPFVAVLAVATVLHLLMWDKEETQRASSESKQRRAATK
jgi:cyanate permease